jgi:hypothetical protein
MFALLCVVLGMSVGTCNQSLACPCGNRVFPDGFASVCIKGECVPKSLPGDRCVVNSTSPCVGECVNEMCNPVSTFCTFSEQCSWSQFCNNGICEDRSYLTEKCGRGHPPCELDAFCGSDATCDLLFVKSIGE